MSVPRSRHRRSDRRGPFLELRDLDLEATGPGERSHALVRVDAEHLTAPLLERPGGDPGAKTDVEDVVPRAGGQDRLHHRFGVGRTSPVVTFGLTTKRLGDLSGVVRFAGQRPAVWR